MRAELREQRLPSFDWIADVVLAQEVR